MHGRLRLGLRSMVAAGVVAACGSPRPVPTKVPAPPVTVVDASVPDAPVVEDGSVLVPTATPLRAAIAAPPSSQIVAIAVTSDGKAALTSDDLGGLRLWPAVDGTHEPMVVNLPRAKEMAIASTSDGQFLVGLRDEPGGLVVARLDAGGRTVAHGSIGPDPAFRGVVALEHALLAWRADHTLVMYGEDGRPRARLMLAPGERIVDVAGQGQIAAALVDADGALSVRMIAVAGDKLAWGAKLEGVPNGELSVSPGGKRVAIVTPQATGVAPMVQIREVNGGTKVEQSVGPSLRAAFIDDEHLVLGDNSVETMWITLPAGTVEHRAFKVTNVLHRGFAGAPGAIVLGAATDLAVVTGDGTTYLGYDVSTPSTGDAGAGGSLMVAGVGGKLAVLDKELALKAGGVIDLPQGSSVYAARGVSADEWLVEASGANGRVATYLVDSRARTADVAHEQSNAFQPLGFEPTTGLVTYSYGQAAQVFDLDRAKKTLEPRTFDIGAKPGTQVMVAPVAPDLADGARLVSVASANGKSTLAWHRDSAGAQTTSSIELAASGTVAAIDRAGHAYVWERPPNARNVVLAVYRNGEKVSTISTDGAVGLSPNRKGTRIAENGSHGLVVHEVSGGAEVWRADVEASGQVYWLDDGSLALVTPGGIVRFDGDTGKVQSARCGWGFGKASVPHPMGHRAEPVCTLAR